MRRLLFIAILALVGYASISARAAEPDSEAAKALQRRSLGATAVDATADQFKMWWHEAPSTFHDGKLPLKGLPLWHTNGELSDEKIHEIFERGQENGFGGITFLPLGRTTPKYLSDEYMTQYGKMLKLADKLGMKVIFYDDVDFPSGLAGGQLKEKFPDSTIKRLEKVEWEVKGPEHFKGQSPIPLGDDVLFGHSEGAGDGEGARRQARVHRFGARYHRRLAGYPQAGERTRRGRRDRLPHQLPCRTFGRGDSETEEGRVNE